MMLLVYITCIPPLCSATCDFWSVTSPTAVTRYTLTVTAVKPEDCITHPDSVLASNATPTDEELGMPTVEVGVANSIWDDLLPPPSKKVKVHSPSPPRTESIVAKLTNGMSVETSPTTIMTFVPYFKDSTTLLLYPAQHLNGISPNKEHHTPLPYRAVDGFKIPKKRLNSISPPTAETTPPINQVLTTPTLAPSNEAVTNSVTLQRLKGGLHGNPFSLTFTVTSGDGRSWSNDRLEGRYR